MSRKTTTGAVIAILGGIVAILTQFGMRLDWATPEVIDTVGTIISTLIMTAGVFVIGRSARDNDVSDQEAGVRPEPLETTPDPVTGGSILRPKP